MMRIEDETLIAFADGELEGELRARVAEALIADPELRARLDAQRRLRDRISGHYAPVAGEPVPERLTALLSGASGDGGKVADLAEARQRTRPAWREFAALAATLVLGLFAGHMLPLGPGGPVAVEDGTMIARGALAEALDSQLAFAQPADAPTRIGVSFAAADGRMCRTFDSSAMSGLACRAEGGWQLVMTAAGAKRTDGEYRQAGAPSPLVMQAAQEIMAGEPLDAAGERLARDSGWENRPPAD